MANTPIVKALRLISSLKLYRLAPMCLLMVSVPCVFAYPASIQKQADTGLRDLRQLQSDVRQHQAIETLQSMKSKQDKLKGQTHSASQSIPDAGIHFTLNQITTDPSEVLTDKEIQEAVAPWINRSISTKDLSGVLDAINTLYQSRGYAVCRATLQPQRIRGGVLHITLIEGKTDSVTVEGLKHTNERYVLRALPMTVGKVANYREMQRELVRFNMTNDIELMIDIRPGSQPETTSYHINAYEPDRWNIYGFADTTGSDSTGRYRGGVNITNNSLFGWQDKVSLLGVGSEGSQSVMLSYVVPINSFGTKISATASAGRVDVIDGPSSDLDIEGNSYLYALRLEHPFYVDESTKFTMYLEGSQQESQTDMFTSIRINDTKIRNAVLGANLMWLPPNHLFFADLALLETHAQESVYDADAHYRRLTGNFLWRFTPIEKWTIATSGAFQAVLGGDELLTTDYFYLGHTSGIRGYDNDLLSAEEGYWVNFQVSREILNPQTALFAFVDAGRIEGYSPYRLNTLASTGLGVTCSLFDLGSMTATASFPLKRHFDDLPEIDSVRYDLTISLSW